MPYGRPKLSFMQWEEGLSMHTYHTGKIIPTRDDIRLTSSRGSFHAGTTDPVWYADGYYFTNSQRLYFDLHLYKHTQSTDFRHTQIHIIIFIKKYLLFSFVSFIMHPDMENEDMQLLAKHLSNNKKRLSMD